MAQFDLNLSTRPFPAYRRINITLAVVLIILVVVSISQAIGFTRYSKMAGSIRTEEQETRIESEALGKRVAELESRLDRPESAAKLNEIGFLNHLILRKDLSWTRLFAVLEELIPDNVHLTNLTPDVGPNGTITLHLGIRGRSMPDIKEFLQRVEKSPMFEKLDVTTEEKRDQTVATTPGTDVDVMLSAIYYPQRETR